MSKLKLLAPAKVNLFLHVLGRRSDGYHNLQTAFQFLDFHDELTFSKRSDRQISLTLSPKNLAPIAVQQNLVWRAAKLLQEQTETPFGVDIHLTKNIPIGAGLGGGSSDAASTLLALNTLWQLNQSRPELAELGLKLGADVPVFIHGHASFAEGIGEQCAPINPPECWALIIVPACQISTAEIFAAPELTRNNSPITIDDFLTRGGGNDCELVVRQRYPAVDQALNWLNQYGPAKMTGTGSCVFAFFQSQQEALAIQRKMPKNLHGFVTQTLNRSPTYPCV